MCGIVGIISTSPIELPILQKMNNKLIHRGPNDYGYLYSHAAHNISEIDHLTFLNLQHSENPYFAFAHRRLAIHDLTNAGQQPMSYLKRYWIIFNGEIYNFIELKAELIAQGYSFNSHTDTEIIMAAYDYWGAECVNKFNGEWAFACIDLLKNKFFIARDRFGIKPLYYFVKPGLFIFASEIKAILEHPEVPKIPNISYLQHYIKNGASEYIEETAFEKIYHFNFSSYFEGAPQDLLTAPKPLLHKFWSINPNLSNESCDEIQLSHYAKKYAELLEDAVKIRLRADVPLAINLSGGVDSTCIAYLINKLHIQENIKDHLNAFSSIYPNQNTIDCDESHQINEIANFLNIHSHQIEPVASDIPYEHRKMIYYMDTPPDSTLMSSWYTAKLEQSSNMVVTLSGEGADENLAGYLRYIAYYFSNSSIQETVKNYRLFKNISGARRYVWIGVIANLMQKIIGKRATQRLYELSGRKEKLFTPINEKLIQDIFSGLVNLHHVDERTFMAHSIEHRAPFMDHRLIELLASVPASYKLTKGWTKYLARFAFNEKLPNSIMWNKHKLGWPIPERFWFEGELKSWLENVIKNSNFLKSHFSFLTKDVSQLSLLHKIRLLNIAVWHDVFFNALLSQEIC